MTTERHTVDTETQDPYVLMRDLLNHDQAIYKAARDGITANLAALLGPEGAAQGLRALMQDVLYENWAAMYEMLCADVPGFFPANRSHLEWARGRISRGDFNDLDWDDLAYDLAEDEIDEYRRKAEEKEKH